MDWGKTRNIAKLPEGSYRSVAGYAGESLVVGRALLCGFNLFFKAWRDSKYDAVLDAEDVLYRIEIKQTLGSTHISVSSGGRSGEQISREVESRERPISTDDCDFLIATQSTTGLCWVIPAELIEILELKQINIKAISAFEEKWSVFTLNDHLVTPHLKTGFRGVGNLGEIATHLEIAIDQLDANFSLDSSNNRLKKYQLSGEDRLVAEIWKQLFFRLS
ncbi:hypothetical protein FJZ55_06880 [Candidatus Woesearchaeota archaeon]|nr:hypothetical protein [Candidatus Woesearchaeota archaeon]